MALQNPDEYIRKELTPDEYARYKEGLLGRKRKNFCDDCVAVCKSRNPENKFYPSCKRSSDEEAETYAQGLPPDQAKLLAHVIDTVDWARDELGWHARFYQAQALRCSSRKIAIRCGRRAGKALDVDTPMPTPNGWTTMGKLEAGDKVFDEQGQVCNIISTTGYQYNRHCFRVSFSDGTELIADADHQWTVHDKKYRKSQGRKKKPKNPNYLPTTITTQQMLENLYVWCGNKFEVNYAIPVTEAVQYAKKELPIDPWVFGLWLAGGSCDTGRITIGDTDQQETLYALQNAGFYYNSVSDITFHITGLHTKLRKLGVLKTYGKNANGIDKHIPQHYLTASTQQRERLLQGLMDGDGTIDKRNGRCEFSIVNKKLILQVKELVESLGYRTHLSEGPAILYKNGTKKYCGIRYRLNFTAWKPVFTLKRKLRYQNLRTQSTARTRYRYITKIEAVESRPVKCIAVDSPSQLYLAGKSYIPTHNTTLLAVKALHLAVTKPDTKPSEPYVVLVVAPYEAQVEKFFEMMMDLLDNAKTVKLSKRKQDPQTIQFANGSKIIGFSAVAGTQVMTSKGLVPIENIKKGDTLLTLNPDTGHYEYQPCTDIFEPNYKEVYRLTLKNGAEVVISDDHPLWTPGGWKKLKNLDIGSKVGASISYESFDLPDVNISDDAIFILGCLIGDGTLTKAHGSWAFTCKNSALQARFEKCMNNMGSKFTYSTHLYTGSREYVLWKTNDKQFRNNGKTKWSPLYKAVQEANLDNTNSSTKRISGILQRLSNRQISILLEGLLATDGWVSQKGIPRIEYYSISKEFIQDIQHLLRRLGIRSLYYSKKNHPTEVQYGKKIHTINSTAVVHRLSIVESQSLHKLRNLDIPGKSLFYIKETLDKHKVWDRFSADPFKEKLKEVRSDMSRGSRPKVSSISKRVSRQRAIKLAKNHQSEDLELLTNQLADSANTLPDMEFVEISNIVHEGKQTTYDIEVDKTHCFIANDIVLHNTAGHKTGARSDKIRGQGANCILLDESDYLRDKDIDTIMAILASHEDCRLYFSSTPSGLPTKFKAACETADMGFKEFWFTSHESPAYSDDADKDFKRMFDRISFEHEILAKFGIPEGGVFLPQPTRACIQDYPLGQPLGPDEHAIIGVDCNDQNTGTHAVVMAAKVIDGKTQFRVADKQILRGTEFSHSKSKDMLIQMFEKWQPVLLAMDKGYAHGQIEALREYAWKNPASRMIEAIKEYDFGSSYKYVDPMTGENVTKPMKPIMVGLSQRIVAEQMLVLPKCEDVPNGLVNQMLKFHIKSINPDTHQPKYSGGDDHTLTAMMVAILSWVLEISGFDPITPSNKIVSPVAADVPDDIPLPVPNQTRGLAQPYVERSMDDEPTKPRRSRSPHFQRRKTKIPTKRKMF